MNNFGKGGKKIRFLILFFILAGLVEGFFLRRIEYCQKPEPYVILDEHTNVWHGLSIRKTGIPTAWSIIAAYKDDSKKFGSGGGVDGFTIKPNDEIPTLPGYRKIKSPVTAVFQEDLGNGMHHIPLVQPYLDHPPFGALVLSLGVSRNANTFADVSLCDVRRSSLVLAVITQILIAIFVYQLTGRFFATIVASFAYGTVPSFLLLSRYAQLENVLTPLMLLSLIILLFLSKNRKNLSSKSIVILILLSSVFSGFCALTKLSGWISVWLGIILLSYWKFDRKYIFYYAIPAIAIGFLYFIWGLYLSPKLFIDLFAYQGVTRGFIGSLNLLTTLVKVNIFNFPFDGWWIGGFIALLLLPKDKKYFSVFVSVALILFSALFLGGANYPWYYIPLIPFLCLSIGVFFDELAKNPNPFSILTAFFIFVSSSFYWGYGVYYASLATNNYQQPFTLYRIIFLLMFAVSIFINKFKKIRSFKPIWYGVVIILFFGLMLLNHRGMYYILEHWGKLPSLYTPGTF